METSWTPTQHLQSASNSCCFCLITRITLLTTSSVTWWQLHNLPSGLFPGPPQSLPPSNFQTLQPKQSFSAENPPKVSKVPQSSVKTTSTCPPVRWPHLPLVELPLTPFRRQYLFLPRTGFTCYHLRASTLAVFCLESLFLPKSTWLIPYFISSNDTFSVSRSLKQPYSKSVILHNTHTPTHTHTYTALPVSLSVFFHTDLFWVNYLHIFQIIGCHSAAQHELQWEFMCLWSERIHAPQCSLQHCL